jgi:hypothetical protein
MNAPSGAAMSGPAGHDHAWHLVSVESDGGVEVRELLCTTCQDVHITG